MTTEPASPTPTPPLVSPPELSVAEVIGRLMHFWGFKRPMGRVWSILYLSPRPMTAADLSESLKMSAGAMSMALAELEKWGAVNRAWIPGDRRDFFSAESDIWKLVQRVMKERELAIVNEFTRTLRSADEKLAQQQVATAADSAEKDLDLGSELSYKRRRVAQLLTLSSSGEALLGALVEGAAINPSSVLKFETSR